MQLEAATAEIRPRNAWEAIDLGCLLVRRHWRTIMAAWSLSVLPLMLLLYIALRESSWIAALIVWWLKPAYDRLILFILSRALFDAAPGAREAVRAWPRELWRSGILASLTLYRFDLARSFSLPPRQLEGLGAKPRRQRMRVLQQQVRGTAVWLTVICLHFEWVIVLSLFALLAMLVPNPLPFDYVSLFADPTTVTRLDWLGNLFGAIAISLIEPFYVGAGFGLYINRRARLEGWDIELAFRRLQRRLSAKSGRSRAAVVLAACLCIGLLLGHPETGRAAQPTPPADPKALIQEVLQEDAFSQTREVDYWRYIGDSDDASDEDKVDLDAMANFSRFIGDLVEALLWVGGGLLIVWLLINAPRWRGLFPGNPRLQSDTDRPQTLFGMDVRADRLPQDIPGEARRLWQQGESAAALSLLYRGALVALMDDYGLRLPPGATEGDCMHAVAGYGQPKLAQDFTELTRAWLACAYAHRLPRPETFEALCRDWQTHFEKASAQGEGTAPRELPA